MAKAQTQQSAGQVNQANTQVQTDVGNLYSNLLGQQNPMRANADQTLATGQGQGQVAQSTIQSASPTYQDFMKTGGFSPTDETTFLNRATRGVSGTYDVLGQAAQRQRAAAGGLGTGGEFSQMARQGGQAVAAANTDAMAQLKAQENQNKLAGAAGTVNQGNALTSLYGQTNQLYNAQTGAVSEQGRQILQALGLKYSTEEEGAAILANLSKNPGLLSNIQQSLAIGSSALTGAFGASPGGKIGG